MRSLADVNSCKLKFANFLWSEERGVARFVVVLRLDGPVPYALLRVYLHFAAVCKYLPTRPLTSSSLTSAKTHISQLRLRIAFKRKPLRSCGGRTRSCVAVKLGISRRVCCGHANKTVVSVNMRVLSTHRHFWPVVRSDPTCCCFEGKVAKHSVWECVSCVRVHVRVTPTPHLSLVVVGRVDFAPAAALD